MTEKTAHQAASVPSDHIMGVYNRAQKKILVNRTIPQAEIPQDGKFHLYHLGTFEIGATTILWVHWSWLLSIGIDSAYLTHS